MRYFDLHCDTVYECSTKGERLGENSFQLSLEQGRNLEGWVQTFACWISDEFRGEDAYQEFLREYRFLERALAEEEALSLYAPGLTLEPGRCYAIPSIEGGAALGGCLDRVEEFWEKGIRMITLTWNGDNEIAGGALGTSGLTAFGEQVIREMERMGMIVDVSHLNDQSFWQVERLATRPFVASHSNARAVCGHRRNLTDDMIRAIVERGGLIGVNFYVDFLSDQDNTGWQDILRQIEHMLSLGGERVLAIGSDFDGAQMPNCINRLEKIEKLYQVMVQYLGKGLAEAVLFQNAARFYESCRP